VELQHFAGAGAEVCWPGSGSGYLNSYKILQKQKIQQIEFESKNYYFVDILRTFSGFMFLKKHENFMKP
jgi:hypothetical protein